MPPGGKWSETPFLSRSRSPSQGIHRDGSQIFPYPRGVCSRTGTRQVVTGTPVWVDRERSRSWHPSSIRRWMGLINVRLSPDGKRLALIAVRRPVGLRPHRPAANQVDVRRRQRHTVVDARRTAGNLRQNGAPPMRLLSVPAVQGATPEQISPEGHYHPHGWSPAGRPDCRSQQLFTDLVGHSHASPKEAARLPKPQLQTARNEGRGGAALSPDGRWLAYTFDGTGRDEIWVAPIPALARPSGCPRTAGPIPSGRRTAASCTTSRVER